MDKMIKTTFGKRELYLNYSIDVMFNVIEKYGSVSNALNIVEEDTRQGFAVTRHLGVMMARDGELVRRSLGYEPQPFFTEEDVCERITPYEYSEFRAAVVKAIAAGYGRETKDEAEEVDAGLQKLQQKKTEAAAAEPR